MSEARQTLRRLLRERNEHAERLVEIDERIRERFSAVHAVFVLDMSGFSRLTNRYGVLHFLAMIQRMRDLVLPLVGAPRWGGRVVKCEADDVIALFPDVAAAVDAAFAVQDRLAEANASLPADWDLHVAIGIGHGELLVVGDDDLFGAEVNLASRLGEDVGRPGEILLTAAAGAELDHRPLRLERRTIQHGSLELECYGVARGAPAGS